jgi:hypothetical protein
MCCFGRRILPFSSARRARTGEGRERAKARGVRLGRTPKLTPHQQREALARRAAGEPLTEIGRPVDEGRGGASP